MSDSGPMPPPPPSSDGSSDPVTEEPSRKKWWVIGGAIAVLILLVGLVAALAGGDDDAAPETTEAISETTVAAAGTTEAPDTTEAAPETTEAPDTTEAAPGTTEPPPDTSAPSGDFFGIVWESGVDPERVNTTEGRPELVDGPLSARVDLFLLTPGPDDSEFCAVAVENAFEVPQEVVSCLKVQWRFDVSEEATDTAYMSAAEGVTADGRQVEPLYTDFVDARPGTIENVVVAVYPNLGVGSRIFLSYSADLADDFIFGDWEIVVPDAFQSVDDWFDDRF